MNTTPAAAEPLTTTTRDGLTVAAKADRNGRVWIKMFANLTQARRAAEKLGPDWGVSARRPFLVMKVSA